MRRRSRGSTGRCRSSLAKAGAFQLKGICLLRLKRYEEALAECSKALALAPEDAETAHNVGLALHKLGRNEEAVVYFDRALALNPRFLLSLSMRGTSLQELHRFDEAIASFDSAVAIDPEFADAHWNAALLRLLIGDFEAGWAGREWGREGFGTRLRRPPVHPADVARRNADCRQDDPASQRRGVRRHHPVLALRDAGRSTRRPGHPRSAGRPPSVAYAASKAFRCACRRRGSRFPISICTVRCPACRSLSRHGSRPFRRRPHTSRRPRTRWCSNGRRGLARTTGCGSAWSGPAIRRMATIVTARCRLSDDVGDPRCRRELHQPAEGSAPRRPGDAARAGRDRRSDRAISPISSRPPR